MDPRAATVLPPVFPQSKAAARRYGADPLAMLPLARLHPCARARLVYSTASRAELESLAGWAAALMADDDWQPRLEQFDHCRARLAEAYRDLLDDEVDR